MPCWFSSWDPGDPLVQEVLRAGIFLPLLGYDRRGRYSVLVRNWS